MVVPQSLYQYMYDAKNEVASLEECDHFSAKSSPVSAPNPATLASNNAAFSSAPLPPMQLSHEPRRQVEPLQQQEVLATLPFNGSPQPETSVDTSQSNDFNAKSTLTKKRARIDSAGDGNERTEPPKKKVPDHKPF